MKIITTVHELRSSVSEWRLAGKSIAFVPTMGNLHDGHLQLAREAQKHCQCVVVSIFINPTQFCAGEDFQTYPRTESLDKQKLIASGVDILFLPEVSEMYCPDAKTMVSVADLSKLYCGAFRPGHFEGVATIVCKLFNIVQANIAFFGQKDFQQLAIIRTMVRDLNIPVKIIAVETVREADGLAMSSRNSYLSSDERLVAPFLYRLLSEVHDAILAGTISFRDMEKDAFQRLLATGFVPDYFNICRSSDLNLAESDDVELVLLVAARLGRTRLIDNICFSNYPLKAGQNDQS